MIGTDLTYAASLLSSGKLVAIPTETVYGLAGNALDVQAAAHIFAVKDRPNFDPLIIHTSSLDRVTAWTKPMPPLLRRLADHFMPGPLTLLLEKKAIIPDLVTAGSPLVAVRLPAHPMTQELLQQIDFPLAAPSANPFGYISPTTAQHVADQLGEKIPYILDGGPCRVGLESTIIGLENGQLTVFRKGGLSVEQIEAIAGPLKVKAHSTSNPQAPGMLKSHYAPRVPLMVGDLPTLQRGRDPERTGVLAFRQKYEQIPSKNQIVLSPTGDLEEAAAHLFAALRKLDSMPLDVILAEYLPEQGLGRAINDRLKRASARD